MNSDCWQLTQTKDFPPILVYSFPARATRIGMSLQLVWFTVFVLHKNVFCIYHETPATSCHGVMIDKK